MHIYTEGIHHRPPWPNDPRCRSCHTFFLQISVIFHLGGYVYDVSLVLIMCYPCTCTALQHKLANEQDLQECHSNANLPYLLPVPSSTERSLFKSTQLVQKLALFVSLRYGRGIYEHEYFQMMLPPLCLESLACRVFAPLALANVAHVPAGVGKWGVPFPDFEVV